MLNIACFTMFPQPIDPDKLDGGLAISADYRLFLLLKQFIDVYCGRITIPRQ